MDSTESKSNIPEPLRDWLDRAILRQVQGNRDIAALAHEVSSAILYPLRQENMATGRKSMISE